MMPVSGAKTPSRHSGLPRHPRLPEKAVVARRIFAARIEYGELAVKTDCGARNEWLPVRHAGAIDGVTGRKVVAAVENDIRSGDRSRQRLALQSLSDRSNLDFRIDVGQCVATGRGLCHADARLRCRIWRCRLVRSTVSPSASVMRPMPADAR